MTLFDCAPLLKEIARGKDGARAMSREQARDLLLAILQQRVSPLHLGAVLVALRIKGESVEELAGFLEALRQHQQNQSWTLINPTSQFRPVILPSYNGARHQPNLVPLLALLLARQGVPTLVHGVASFPTRTTSYEIFQALGTPIATSHTEIQTHLAQKHLTVCVLETLNPALAELVALRRVMGVRNSSHTLCKLLQPFAEPAVRLVSYTHPEYALLHADYFKNHQPTDERTIVLRATEGEVVANPRRPQAQTLYVNGQANEVIAADLAPLTTLPDAPSDRSAAVTAAWINEVLAGQRPVPFAIQQQVQVIVQAARI
ncbi:DNA-binding protein YbiB [Parvibium lacunae]|uniref:DNA-binding protein YbiB n=1 Tax=Parvibium lacunae TaxID=1888893 RepID=A0A368L5N4_9BURK|nr:DNA-binding protein YbiB [Parvibium lacunae]RCS58450.1 DNA-binding protein YbiB [Parvibium lacunae]